MKTLLEERFAPVTSDAGFVEAPLDEVAGAFADWRRHLDRRARVGRVARFPDMLHRLEPLTNVVVPREVLVATRGGWTAYFNNGLPSPDVVSPVAHITRTHRWAGLCVGSTPPLGERLGAVQFRLFGAVDTEFLNWVRAIDLVQEDDNRWTFGASGTVQAFEEVESYTARRARDRFTADMLERYCSALGVEVFDPGWYGPDGVVIDSGESYRGRDGLSLTIEQAQRHYGIVPGAARDLAG